MLRAAVIGCGRIGSEFDADPRRQQIATHAGAYRAHPETELAALCDANSANLDRAGERWGIKRLYTDYNEMLVSERPEIVSICTWSQSHLEIASQAVKQGVRAIFCEKPIADTLANADRMVALCESAGVVLQINHQRRYDGFHNRLREFIGAELGRIQQLNFIYTAGIANTGSHIFDLLRYLFGEVAWVSALRSPDVAADAADPDLDIRLGFKSGHPGFVQACDASRFTIFELDCIGSQGRVRLTRNGRAMEFSRVTESQQFSGLRELVPVDPPLDAGALRQAIIGGVSELVACLRDERQSVSSGRDGRAALELICAAHESARADGARISLPLKDSNVVISGQRMT